MKDEIKQIFTKYNIEYDQNKIEQLVKFYEFVIEKNKVMNLTNIVNEKEFILKNILDSVLPEKYIKQNSSLIDVGAGAGFPSIPLKILRPDLNITMLDSLNKRVVFLNEVISVLNLKNIQAVHSRAEDYAKNQRESYDVCVSRAVARLNTLLEYCLPLVKVGGIFIAYKSLKADEEIIESEKALDILGGNIENKQNVIIDEINSIRENIIIRKKNTTPKKYPRNKNLPKIKPIC